jgi:hypothetical protein
MDAEGALRAVLHRHLKGSTVLLDNLDRPLVALAEYSPRPARSDSLLKEIVSEADVEWGRAMDERPHFEREGAAHHRTILHPRGGSQGLDRGLSTYWRAPTASPTSGGGRPFHATEIATSTSPPHSGQPTDLPRFRDAVREVAQKRPELVRRFRITISYGGCCALRSG